MSKPREVIARALYRADVLPRRFDPYWNVRKFDDLSESATTHWYRLADAVIDALEGMEVTKAMRQEGANYGTVNEIMAASIWRAMVGAMRGSHVLDA